MCSGLPYLFSVEFRLSMNYISQSLFIFTKQLPTHLIFIDICILSLKHLPFTFFPSEKLSINFPQIYRSFIFWILPTFSYLEYF